MVKTRRDWDNKVRKQVLKQFKPKNDSSFSWCLIIEIKKQGEKY